MTTWSLLLILGVWVDAHRGAQLAGKGLGWAAPGARAGCPPFFIPCFFFLLREKVQGNPEGIQTFWELQIIVLTFANCSIVLMSCGLSCDMGKRCCLGKDIGTIKVLQWKPEQTARASGEREKVLHLVCRSAECWACRVFCARERSVSTWVSQWGLSEVNFWPWSPWAYWTSTRVVPVPASSWTALLSCVQGWHTAVCPGSLGELFCFWSAPSTSLSSFLQTFHKSKSFSS